MRPERIIGQFLIVFLLCLIPSSGQTQDRPPVEVDMSVLNSMDPAAAPSQRLLPSAAPTSRSSLTTITRPDRVSSPLPGDAGYRQQPYAAAPAAIRPATPDLIHFPVKVQQRSELIDPSLGMPSAEPVHKPAARPFISAPLPELKPVAIAARKPVAKVPLPPRRPAIQNASRDFVQHARSAAVSDLSKGGMKMPAVPAKEVIAEPLKPSPRFAASDDTLARQLLVPDRQALARTIDAATAKVNAPKPVSPAATHRTAAIPTAPASRVVPLDTKAEPIDITAVEPAAGFQTASVIDITEQTEAVPRMPPEGKHELEFISLSFSAGNTDLDPETRTIIANKVAPLLKSNPLWRLQIQAFASEAGRDVESARRTSLSRALAIRGHLLEQGVEARRMDVRALGMQTDREPPDRVDFVFFDPTVNQ